MEGQFEYGKIILNYRLFPATLKGEARLPLFLWVAGDKEVMEQQMIDCLKVMCKEKEMHFMILSYKKENSFEEKEVIKAIQKLIFQIRAERKMDLCKTYIAGLSVGAYGVWQLVSAYPRLFAAAVPISGYGDPYRIRQAKEVPIWAFWKKNDIPVSPYDCVFREKQNLLAGSALLIQSLRNAGGDIKGTELKETQLNWKTLVNEIGNWVVRQNRRNSFRVERLRQGVYKIDDYFMASCYLIEGQEEALLIDTGMGEGDFEALIKGLTEKPVSLAITHPHFDHMYHAHLFDKIYIHAKAACCYEKIYDEMKSMDISAFDNLWGVKCPERGNSHVISLHDGDTIRLGDDCVIKAVWLPGHTPYDCVFIDEKHEGVFTGDAIGSGYTVGVPMQRSTVRKSITAYKASLEHFLNVYGKSVCEYSFWGGHFIQENGCDDTIQEDWLNGQSSFFTPLSLQVAIDMKELCDEILQGRGVNEGKGNEYSWSFKSARIGGSFT